MQLCKWFNTNSIKIQNYISSPGEFYDIKTPTKYENILSSLKKSDNKFNLKLFVQPFQSNDDIICSHKYQITFSNEQHNILSDYFNECCKIYNLCVDIWNDHKDCTSNWFIFKECID